MNRRRFLGTIGVGLLGRSVGTLAAPARSTQLHSSDTTDWFVVNGSDSSRPSDDWLAMLRAAKVGCVVLNEELVLPFFTRTYEFADRHREHVTVATTVREIRQARREGRVALVLGTQGTTALGEEANWIDAPPTTNLRTFYQLGIRIASLTYNLPSIFGGGCLDPAVPLTKAGRHLTEEMHRLGILVDVGGHVGERTSLDVIEMSKGVPIICSHTNPRALVDNPRNTSDRVMDAIATTGGVVGISAISDFHTRSQADATVHSSPRGTLDMMIDHVEYVRKRLGVDHVALGPDFTEGLATGLDPTKSFIYPPEMFGLEKPGTPIPMVQGFERMSEWPNVVTGLRKRGWSDADIGKVLGGNWLRVYEKVWGA